MVDSVLTDLDLVHNETGAAGIAEALRGNEVLTTLDVGYNELTEEAARPILVAFRDGAKDNRID